MRRALALLLPLLLLLPFADPAAAVREDLLLDLGVKSVDATHYPMVQIYLTVSDRDGAYLRNLGQGHFEIAENRFRIESKIVESTLKNLDVVICLDTSASMRKILQDVKRAAYSFVRGLDPMDRAAVVSFDNRVTVVQDFTNDKYLVSNGIFQLRAAGGTLLYDGLFEAINRCMLSPADKAILLITDGEDESYAGSRPFSRHTLEEVLVHAKQVGVPVYVVGIGKNFDKTVMASIANETGGAYYYSPSPYELNRLFKMVLQGFKTFYKITYATPCPYKDGTARAVEIECNVQDRTGHTRVLYMAPGGAMDPSNYVPLKQKRFDSGVAPSERPKFRHLRRDR